MSEGIEDIVGAFFLDCGGERSATAICLQLLRSPVTSLAIPQSYPHA